MERYAEVIFKDDFELDLKKGTIVGSGKKYTFKTLRGLQVAVFIDYIEEPSQNINVSKYIVGTVNIDKWKNKIDTEAEIAELKEKMDNKTKELQEQLPIYEMFAEKGPELKELLTSYKSLLSEPTATYNYSYNYSYNDIQRIKDKATKEAVASASVIMLAIPLKVVYEQLELTKDDCCWLGEATAEEYQNFADEKITLEEYRKQVEELTGMKYVKEYK